MNLYCPGGIQTNVIQILVSHHQISDHHVRSRQIALTTVVCFMNSLQLSHPRHPSFPTPLKQHMAILLPTFVPQCEDDLSLSEVPSVVVRVMRVHTLPRHVHKVATVVAVHRLLNAAARNCKAAGHVAYYVCPKGPGSSVPSGRSRQVDGCADGGWWGRRRTWACAKGNMGR